MNTISETEGRVKKVILGIFVVLLIQAGFISLTSLDRSTESASGITPIISAPGSIEYDSIADLGVAGLDIGIYSDADATRLHRPPYSIRSDVARKGPGKPLPANVTLKPAKPSFRFDPVVISVKTPQPVTPPSQDAELRPAFQPAKMTISVSEGASRKRSFFSRSLSVIKAPYKWIKSLGPRIM